MNRKVINCLELLLIAAAVETGAKITANNCQTQYLTDIQTRETALGHLDTTENKNLFRTWGETDSPPNQEGLVATATCINQRKIVSEQIMIIKNFVRQTNQIANK